MRDLSVKVLLLLPAEMFAVGLVLTGSSSAIWLAILLHTAVSLFAGYCLGRRWAGNSTIGLAFPSVALPVFLLPVLGVVTLFLIDNRDWLKERSQANSAVSDADAERPVIRHFSAADLGTSGYADKSNTRELLSSVDDDAYLGLLVASRHLPDKVAYALLSEALLSPFESARLMAYSLRDKMEERLRSGLKRKLELNPASAAAQARCQLAIANDYFNLVDIGIEDAHGAALDDAARYCAKAMRSEAVLPQAKGLMAQISKKKAKLSTADNMMAVACAS